MCASTATRPRLEASAAAGSWAAHTHRRPQPSAGTPCTPPAHPCQRRWTSASRPRRCPGTGLQRLLQSPPPTRSAHAQEFASRKCAKGGPLHVTVTGPMHERRATNGMGCALTARRAPYSRSSCFSSQSLLAGCSSQLAPPPTCTRAVVWPCCCATACTSTEAGTRALCAMASAACATSSAAACRPAAHSSALGPPPPSPAATAAAVQPPSPPPSLSRCPPSPAPPPLPAPWSLRHCSASLTDQGTCSALCAKGLTWVGAGPPRATAAPAVPPAAHGSAPCAPTPAALAPASAPSPAAGPGCDAGPVAPGPVLPGPASPPLADGPGPPACVPAPLWRLLSGCCCCCWHTCGDGGCPAACAPWTALGWGAWPGAGSGPVRLKGCSGSKWALQGAGGQ